MGTISRSCWCLYACVFNRFHLHRNTPSSSSVNKLKDFIFIFVNTFKFYSLVNGFLVAFTFRLSHYFICYLSEFTMIAAGFDNAEAEDSWNYCVAKPFYVEFPDSLQSVINYWNIPMYKFLKKSKSDTRKA